MQGGKVNNENCGIITHLERVCSSTIILLYRAHYTPAYEPLRQHLPPQELGLLWLVDAALVILFRHSIPLKSPRG